MAARLAASVTTRVCGAALQWSVHTLQRLVPQKVATTGTVRDQESCLQTTRHACIPESSVAMSQAIGPNYTRRITQYTYLHISLYGHEQELFPCLQDIYSNAAGLWPIFPTQEPQQTRASIRNAETVTRTVSRKPSKAPHYCGDCNENEKRVLDCMISIACSLRVETFSHPTYQMICEKGLTHLSTEISSQRFNFPPATTQYRYDTFCPRGTGTGSELQSG